jgi:hypothetical protein
MYFGIICHIQNDFVCVKILNNLVPILQPNPKPEILEKNEKGKRHAKQKK